MRLLEPVPLQPRCREEQTHHRQQGTQRGRLSGLPEGRGPLCASDPRVPGPRQDAVRAERSDCHGPLSASAQAQGPVRGIKNSQSVRPPECKNCLARQKVLPGCREIVSILTALPLRAIVMSVKSSVTGNARGRAQCRGAASRVEPWNTSAFYPIPEYNRGGIFAAPKEEFET